MLIMLMLLSPPSMVTIPSLLLSDNKCARVCVCARVWHTLLRLLLSGQLSAREKARKEGPSLLSKTRKETHLLFDGSRVLQTYQANLVNNAEVMLPELCLSLKEQFLLFE